MALRPADAARATRLAEPPYDPAKERFNDGKCDPQGRFWVGTIYEPRDAAKATLYCWGGGKLVKRADDITVGNGLAWSPNGRTLYWSDTKAHTIYAFDFEPASGSAQRPARVRAASRSSRPASRSTATAAGPTVPRSMPRAATGSRCSKVSALLRLSPAGELLREVRAAGALRRPCPASAAPT